MILNEITTPYDNPDIEIGTMTLNEFLKWRNPENKIHPDGSYEVNVKKLNTDVFQNHVLNIYNIDLLIKENKNGKILEIDGKPQALLHNDILYYTIFFPVEKLIPFDYENQFKEKRIIIKPKEKKKIKYIDDYIHLVDRVSDRNLTRYSGVINRFKKDDEYFTVRTTNIPYAKNSGEDIVILNQDGYKVASAQDEWGTTLLIVTQEYRGKDFGQLLGKLWYKWNPKYLSGGFTPKGARNAQKIWEDRVRTLLKNGWYSYLVGKNVISKEKAKMIIDSLPERKVEKDTIKKEADPLLFVDEFSFVLYDKKFFDDQDEKWIYAYGFLREHMDKPFVFTLDYEKQYREIATYIIFQIAHNNGEKLYVAGKPSDHIEFEGLSGITFEGDYAYLSKPFIDLNKYSNIEKKYRKKHDPYDEYYHRLLEMANSKWR